MGVRVRVRVKGLGLFSFVLYGLAKYIRIVTPMPREEDKRQKCHLSLIPAR